MSAFGGFWDFRSRLQRDSFVLKSIKRSVLNIRRSMLDFRCSTFNQFTVSVVVVSHERRLWPRASSLIGKETLQFGIGCFWIVGAVFNRDYPFNRGWKPLPPTINYSPNDIELNVVSHEHRRWPEKRPV